MHIYIYIYIYLQENEDIDKAISKTTTPRIVGVGQSLDPIYLAVEGQTIGGALKTHSLVEVPIVLIAVYYTFNIQYSFLFPFLEAVLFDNNHIIKGKVVVHKVITCLQYSQDFEGFFLASYILVIWTCIRALKQVFSLVHPLIYESRV